MPILNPNPVTPATFSGMWIASLHLMFPSAAKRGMLSARLLPYDGQHLLATGGVDLRLTDLAAKRQADPAFDSMLTSLEVELDRQSGTDAAWERLTVVAPDPTKPVVATAFTVERAHHRIPDCFVLAATDAGFAAVLQATLSEVARQAGLTVQ
jgi:hypothetical protein